MPAGMSLIAIENCFPACGWVVEPQILDAGAVVQCRSLLDSRLEELRAIFSQPDAPEGEDLRHFQRGEFDLATRLDLKVVNLLAGPRVMDFLKRFLQGVDSYLIHYPPMIRFKLPSAEASMVPLHQDSAYNAHLEDFFTVWVPLVDIDEDCGGVVVYEGSQHQQSLPHSAAGGWEKGLGESEEHWKTSHPHMRAGDLLIFPKNLLHKSAPHSSPDRVRFSVDFRVFLRPDQTLKSYFDPATGQVTRR